MKAILIWLSLIGTAVCQNLDVQSKLATAVTVLSDSTPVVYGNIILSEGAAKVEVSEVAVIDVISDMKYIDITARKSLKEMGNLTPTQPLETCRQWILSGEPGEYLVEVVGFDPTIRRRSILVTIGKVKPEPVPDPVPDNPDLIPENLPTEFDEISKRVYQWSKGLTKTKEVAAVYDKYSKLIITDPTVTLGSVTPMITAELSSISKSLTADLDIYKTMTNNINMDLQARWPMSKGVLSLYWSCIAKGLEARQ